MRSLSGQELAVVRSTLRRRLRQDSDLQKPSRDALLSALATLESLGYDPIGLLDRGESALWTLAIEDRS